MKVRTLGMVVVGAAGLVALPACKKDEAPTHAASAVQPSVAPAPAQAAPAVPDNTSRGTVKGSVTFAGEVPAPADMPTSADPSCAGMPQKEQSLRVKDGKLQNVLVRVRGPVAGAALPSTPVVIDQTKCTYEPRVQGAMAGQPIQVRNSDGTLHNVRGLSEGKAVFNVAQPPNAQPVQRPMPEGVEVLKLKCDVHPWMAAAIVVSPHPYFATTGEDGTFTLAGVPAGTYTLEAWHETLGTQTAEVTVKEGATSDATFGFTAAAK
ncbi:carboxypeptidase regulatory-like domain-containing protein [Myxococcaceae bacterium GXIMD 01537]